MTAAPGQFVAHTPELRDGRAAPENWGTTVGDTAAVDVFAANTDRTVQVFALGAEATPAQRRAFETARSEWLAHDDASVIVSVVAHGDEPRPWLAIEPPTDSTADRPELVRSVMIDLAEAVWLIESAGRSTQLRRAEFRLGPTAGRAQVCWPLDTADSRADSVERIGAVGYELLTGTTPPADGALGWPADDTEPSIWPITDAALTGEIHSPYELKRALLFGPATPLAGEHPTADTESPTPTKAESPGRTLPEQVSRRTAVGVLGLGALGLTGLFARGDDTASPESNPETPPEAAFQFEQGRTTLTVTHDGGDEIKAGRLSLRNTRVSGTGTYQWSEYEGYDHNTTVAEGDSIVVDRGVLSMWHVDVVWTAPDGETETVLEERRISEEDLSAAEKQR